MVAEGKVAPEQVVVVAMEVAGAAPMERAVEAAMAEAWEAAVEKAASGEGSVGSVGVATAWVARVGKVEAWAAWAAMAAVTVVGAVEHSRVAKYAPRMSHHSRGRTEHWLGMRPVLHTCRSEHCPPIQPRPLG